jgi:hypothetical protein
MTKSPAHNTSIDNLVPAKAGVDIRIVVAPAVMVIINAVVMITLAVRQMFALMPP